MAWITDQVLLAGAGISENNWQDVVNLGVTAVVNMRSEHQDTFGMPLPVAYLWLPVPDFTEPTPEQLLLAAQMIDTLVKNKHKGTCALQNGHSSLGYYSGCIPYLFWSW